MKSPMTNKQIKNKLQIELGKWTESIEDSHVRMLARRNAIVAGGSLTSMITGNEVNDYDVYFKSEESVIAISQYYINKFNEQNGDCDLKVKIDDGVSVSVPSNGIAGERNSELNKDIKYRPVFISENAITLSDKIQLIIKFVGTADEITENFDFVHAKCSYDLIQNELITPIDALRSIQSNTLEYTGSYYPLASLFRLRKFLQRGWNINAGEMFKIALEVQDLDLYDIHTLKKQLVGVDILYFKMFLDMLDMNKAKDGKFEKSYIVSLINKVFGN